MKQRFASLLLVFFLSGVSFAADEFEQARGIIGVLPLPELFGSSPCDRFDSQPLTLFQKAHSTTPVGRIYQSRPWTFYPNGGCSGLEVSVSHANSSQGDKTLPTLEFSYEKPGAIVLARDGEWYKVALQQGSAWVHFQNSRRYLPVEYLLKGSLTYMRISGGMLPLVKRPDEGAPISPPSAHQQRNVPVEVLGFKTVNGTLWVKVRVLEIEPCSQERSNMPAVTGWLPFLDRNRIPAVWFYSRGC